MTIRFLIAVLFMPLLVPMSASFAEDAAPNTLTKEEEKAGYKLLFDGKSLDGWRVYGKKTPAPSNTNPNPKPDTGPWEVKDGAISMTKDTGSGDLMTVAKYANFELLIDFKFIDGNNSGIIYRVLESNLEPSYMSGPEMQVMHHKPTDTLGKTAGGSLYDMYAADSNPFKADSAKNWTSYKLVVNGNNIEHWVNGVKVVDCEIGSADWNERLAKSKWKDAKNFATQKTGHIALQDHGAKVMFRNVKIRVME